MERELWRWIVGAVDQGLAMITLPVITHRDEHLWLDRMVSDLLADEPEKFRRAQSENRPEPAPVGVTSKAKEKK